MIREGGPATKRLHQVCKKFIASLAQANDIRAHTVVLLRAQEIENSAHLKASKAFEELDDSTKRTKRSPYVSTSIKEHVGYILKLSVKDVDQFKLGRRVSNTTPDAEQDTTKPVWAQQSKAADGSEEMLIILANAEGEIWDYKIKLDDVYGMDLRTGEALIKFGSTLEKLINTYPHGAPITLFAKRLLVNASIVNAGGAWMPLDSPIWHPEHCWQIKIHYIDEKNGEAKELVHTANKSINPGPNGPTIPDYVTYRFKDGNGGTTLLKSESYGEEADWKSLLPEDAREQARKVYDRRMKPLNNAMLHNQEYLLRWFVYTFHGAVTTADKLKEAILNLEYIFANPSRAAKSKGAYDLPLLQSKSLFTVKVSAKEDCTWSGTTDKYAELLQMEGIIDPSKIWKLETTNPYWISGIIEYCQTAYLEEFDVYDALCGAAFFIDNAHALDCDDEIQSLPYPCGPDVGKWIYHSCHECLKIDRCVDMTITYDLTRVCKGCGPGDEEFMF